jgi:hypothetical protein
LCCFGAGCSVCFLEGVDRLQIALYFFLLFSPAQSTYAGCTKTWVVSE